MPSLLDDLARRGFISADDVRPPPTGETIAHPRADEVVVFRDLFTAGLQMPLDPVVVDIFRLFKVYLHQMTPTSIVRLNLYMWLAKTYRLSPSAEGFARALLTLLSAPDLYTASARFRVAFPSEYSPKVYQSTEPKRQETIY